MVGETKTGVKREDTGETGVDTKLATRSRGEGVTERAGSNKGGGKKRARHTPTRPLPSRSKLTTTTNHTRGDFHTRRVHSPLKTLDDNAPFLLGPLQGHWPSHVRHKSVSSVCRCVLSACATPSAPPRAGPPAARATRLAARVIPLGSWEAVNTNASPRFQARLQNMLSFYH